MSMETAITELACAIKALATTLAAARLSTDVTVTVPAPAPAPETAPAPRAAQHAESEPTTRRGRGRPSKNAPAAEADPTVARTPVPNPAAEPVPAAEDVDVAAERLFDQFADDEDPFATDESPTNVVTLKPATLDDCRQVLTEVSNHVSRDKAISLLKSFGATKLGELKPERFDDLVAQARTLLQGAA